MATITYTATGRDGRTFTRSSGTMYYTHMSLARGSWHTTHAAAVKAGDPVPAVPTAVNGYAEIGYYADHPNAAAIDALIAAKLAAAVKAAPVQGARVKRGAPIKGKLGKAEPIRSMGDRIRAVHAADAARAAEAGVLIGTLHTNQTDAAPASDTGTPVPQLPEVNAAVFVGGAVVPHPFVPWADHAACADCHGAQHAKLGDNRRLHPLP